MVKIKSEDVLKSLEHVNKVLDFVGLIMTVFALSLGLFLFAHSPTDYIHFWIGSLESFSNFIHHAIFGGLQNAQ